METGSAARAPGGNEPNGPVGVSGQGRPGGAEPTFGGRQGRGLQGRLGLASEVGPPGDGERPSGGAMTCGVLCWKAVVKLRDTNPGLGDMDVPGDLDKGGFSGGVGATA